MAPVNHTNLVTNLTVFLRNFLPVCTLVGVTPLLVLVVTGFVSLVGSVRGTMGRGGVGVTLDGVGVFITSLVAVGSLVGVTRGVERRSIVRWISARLRRVSALFDLLGPGETDPAWGIHTDTSTDRVDIWDNVECPKDLSLGHYILLILR